MHPHWKLLQPMCSCSGYRCAAATTTTTTTTNLLTTNSEGVGVLFDLLQKFRHVVNIIHGFGMSRNSANIQQTLVFLSAFLLQ
jgi:hypothetical protein